MINAREARVLSKKNDKVLVRIEELIIKAANTGKYSTNYKGEVDKDTKKVLNSLGYSLNQDNNTQDWTISW